MGATEAGTGIEARNGSALKEWAAVEQALGEGRVALLIRKGGIYEQRQGFQVEHREFWIFPTLYHQNPDELSPELHPFLEAARVKDPGIDHVRLEHYAVVTDALRVESLEAVERLEGLHPLTRESVHSRFHYRNKPYLHALLVRVYRMPEPYVVPNTLDYQGCVSWVALDEEMPTAGAVPVLTDGEFEEVRAEVLRRLGEAGVVRL